MEYEFIDIEPYDEFLSHVGCTQEESRDITPTGSGRYLKGSGDNSLQHPHDFLDRVERLKRTGWTETSENIREAFGMSTTEYRAYKKIAAHDKRQERVDTANKLMEELGGNRMAVARAMSEKYGEHISESSIRSLLDTKTAERKSAAQNTADLIKEQLKAKGSIDVGKGVELEMGLGVSAETMKESLTMLEMEGYHVTTFGLKQVTGKANQQTIMKVIVSPEKGEEIKQTLKKERNDRVEAVKKAIEANNGDYDAAAKSLGYKDRGTIDRLLDPKNDVDMAAPVSEKQIQNYLMNHPGDINSMADYHSKDGGMTYRAPEYPASIDSSRVMIRYGDQGGYAKDGTIELRRGVADLSLGNDHYAQVRILVDGDRYMKGMAFYSDDKNFPDGIDVIYNRPEKSDVPMRDVLKKTKHDDPMDPFGSTITAAGQYHYIDKDGNEKLGAINKLRSEGAWEDQQINLSQQFLSKQPLKFIKNQLNITYADYEAEYDEIMSIQNPTVRKKCLNDFAGTCDSASVTLKAAAMPKQHTRVLLPVDSLKDNEVYARDYKDGTEVMLIRYPHAGPFELVKATVNNKNKEGQRVLGDAYDAIGLNPNAVGKLSGADYDGDTATIFPIPKGVKLSYADQLSGLKNYEPKAIYAGTMVVDENGKEHWYRNGKEYKVMPKSSTNREMGIASNLITDMTLGGADEQELTRAVRHSMTVIDAAKHHLDYMASYKENDIDDLKRRYQKHVDPVTGEEKYGGASTLLSTRKQATPVPERQGQAKIDPNTGELIYKNSGRKYYDKKGNLVEATIDIPKMMSVKDAHELSTGSQVENAYADYANKMKALANRARKEYAATPNMVYDRNARETYKSEVERLELAVRQAKLNAPRERRAQAIANSKLKSMTAENPNLPKDKKTYGKLKTRVMAEARDAVSAGSKKNRITLSQREWDAINNGAVSDSFAQQIFRFCEDNQVRSYATPKKNDMALSQAKINQIKSRWNSGMSKEDIAESLGISMSSVNKYLA